MSSIYTYQSEVDFDAPRDIEPVQTDHVLDPSTSSAQEAQSDIPVLPRYKFPQKSHTISPLRYPGSKKKIISSLVLLMEANDALPDWFVEPFAGGASISLGLLHAGVVKKALIADLDPLVASFWQECGENPDRLIEDMYDEPVTLDRWDFWRGYDPKNRRERALKCLFINRTSFSGIMNGSAGPIGGRRQESIYKIDCRFNKVGLAKRIKSFGELFSEGRIEVRHQSWQKTLMEISSRREDPLVYADPPYIEKAKKLYIPSFSLHDHRQLSENLLSSFTLPWIVSYDDEPLALDLYQGASGIHTYRVEHNYTMRGHERQCPVPGREILFTNLPKFPQTGD